ncbi:MAG TPA: hypothetical protein VMX97_07660, partial [Hyphomicrobiaceae bacterium]|nr:hypothetical protein [Hyphomicrobiaceae bacterium]
MKLLRLIPLLSIALLLSAQRPTFHGAMAGGDPVLAGATAAYFPGPEVAVGHWATPGTNLLLQSGNLLTTWAPTNATVNDATNVTFTAPNGFIQQAYTAALGVNVTIYAQMANATGNTSLHWYHAGIGTG